MGLTINPAGICPECGMDTLMEYDSTTYSGLWYCCTNLECQHSYGDEDYNNWYETTVSG